MPNPNHSPDMLAFTYRIQKIIRDIRHIELPGEDARIRQELVMDALQQVCRRIEEDFG